MLAQKKHRFVVALDGSPNSLRALTEACSLVSA
jgi:hypothetical protein